MKIRHETPAITPPFGCNALMHRQMRKIMCSRGACFVSISVYFCLLLPPLILTATNQLLSQTKRGKRVADRVSVCTGTRQTDLAARLRWVGQDTYPPHPEKRSERAGITRDPCGPDPRHPRVSLPHSAPHIRQKNRKTGNGCASYAMTSSHSAGAITTPNGGTGDPDRSPPAGNQSKSSQIRVNQGESSH